MSIPDEFKPRTRIFLFIIIALLIPILTLIVNFRGQQQKQKQFEVKQEREILKDSLRIEEEKRKPEKIPSTTYQGNVIMTGKDSSNNIIGDITVHNNK